MAPNAPLQLELACGTSPNTEAFLLLAVSQKDQVQPDAASAHPSAQESSYMGSGPTVLLFAGPCRCRLYKTGKGRNYLDLLPRDSWPAPLWYLAYPAVHRGFVGLKLSLGHSLARNTEFLFR